MYVINSEVVDMKKLIRTSMIVYGDVQKGDYRGRVIKIARKMGMELNGVSSITGVIQNLKDEHMVKIIAEGDSNDIDWFGEKIKIRNYLIDVTHVERREKDIEIDEDEREYEGFNKIVEEGETDERLDRAAELIKELAENIGNGFKHAANEMEQGFKEQREYSAKLNTYILEQREHNKRMDSFIERMDDHNLRLEKILEKLTEK
jgi:acylphosphatase